jgi:FkbM family methyltransferase
MIFDIGANIGNWAAANISTCDRIIAIEASPITFATLQSKIKNDRITLLNYAVCNNDMKDITFYHANANTLSTINKEWLTSPDSRFHNECFKEIICPTITIDRLIELYGMPEMIKIDVEGGEYDCVSSLTQKVDQLCFEWASEVNPITFKCLDHLTGLGFQEFFVQIGDAYTFRPVATDYTDVASVKQQLERMTPKKEWGMIWCR